MIQLLLKKKSIWAKDTHFFWNFIKQSNLNIANNLDIADTQIPSEKLLSSSWPMLQITSLKKILVLAQTLLIYGQRDMDMLMNKFWKLMTIHTIMIILLINVESTIFLYYFIITFLQIFKRFLSIFLENKWLVINMCAFGIIKDKSMMWAKFFKMSGY